MIERAPADAAFCDIAIIGGGVNGCGIARDAAGRGLRVMLCEQGDLAQATSSASTKLFHGGLRYLEYYAFRLVREALIERETLLTAMPHIAWPLRFVLPHHEGLRPAWMLRLGLFLYDHLGGRRILPASRMVDLTTDPAGRPLRPNFHKAFEYSDCWVDDARLVVLNARAAAQLGADIRVRTRCISAEQQNGLWTLHLQNTETGERQTITARVVVNAAGPWVDDVIRHTLRRNASAHVRLVRGSHIVVRRLFDHDRAYIFQGADRRIIFAIPYEYDFTLIGTTEADHVQPPGAAVCTEEEITYLIDAASAYFAEPVRRADVVWTFSGVRPLYNEGASSTTAATREYVLERSGASGEAALLNVFGGKITTYRRLAEAALARLEHDFPEMKERWTAGVPLPGGDFPVEGVEDATAALRAAHPFLDQAWARRLVRAYGTEASQVLAGATSTDQLGIHFGWNLTEAEVRWLMTCEWARTADDVLWRRSKLGLRLSHDEAQILNAWMEKQLGVAPESLAQGMET